MRRVGRRSSFVIFVVVGACALITWPAKLAVARPPYMAVFRQEYREYGKISCAFCHPATDKRSHTEYSAALKEALGERNVKDRELIRQAMSEIEDKLPAR